MAGGLPQPQERLEHGDSRLAHAHPADAAGEFEPIVFAELVVGLPLRLAEFAEDRLLCLLGQVGEHLRLRAPQQKRPYRPRHHLRRAAAAATGEKLLEPRGAAELARIEEFKDAPQFADVVLDRRAGERQPVPGP